ncbi:hypothetical protein C0995_014134 [Termitomyces sp. Mi166|nr:hypothetical protein C0995_014134 [Termitomyces sp. Mi166\
MASLPANLLAISEKEFQGTLKRGDGLDQPITTSRKAVIKPDKAQLPKKTRVKRVAIDSMECQPTSSRVKVEDLVTDEEEQSAASALETTNRPPDMQWAYDPRMPSEWNEAVASMSIRNRVASLQPTGEVYRQPMADEISEPLNIFVDGALLKAKSVSWSTTSTVSQPPVRLMTEDTGEVHLRALRERFEPASQVRQKRVDIGKERPQKLSEEDFPRLRQAWQQEFADIVNGTKEELPPWREVNHEINLIDNSRQYKYHLPRCP